MRLQPPWVLFARIMSQKFTGLCIFVAGLVLGSACLAAPGDPSFGDTSISLSDGAENAAGAEQGTTANGNTNGNTTVVVDSANATIPATPAKSLAPSAGFQIQYKANPSLCIQADDAGAAANTSVHVASCANVPPQTFTMSGGRLTLNGITCLNAPSSGAGDLLWQKCADLVGVSWYYYQSTTTPFYAVRTINGSAAFLYPMADGQQPASTPIAVTTDASQQFQFAARSDGSGSFLFPKGNYNVCLADRAPDVVMVDCDASDIGQRWSLPTIGQIVSGFNHCLQYASDSNNNNVSIGNCSTLATTGWGGPLNYNQSLVPGRVPVPSTSTALYFDASTGTVRLIPTSAKGQTQWVYGDHLNF